MKAFRSDEPSGPGPETLETLDADVAVVDCLTLWLSNLLLQDRPAEHVLAEVDRLVNVIEARRMHVLIVTNEVGMGIVPDNALARAFRGIAGLAHQRLAAIADELYFGALGVVLRLRPAPIELAKAQIP